MTSRKAGFDKPACRMAGRSNPYRSTPKVRYVRHRTYGSKDLVPLCSVAAESAGRIFALKAEDINNLSSYFEF